MTPQRQFAESVKYTPRPVVLIPTEEGFVVMEAYGTSRDYICEVRPDELAQWAREDFTAHRDQRPQRQTPARPTLDLQMNLDDLELALNNL